MRLAIVRMLNAIGVQDFLVLLAVIPTLRLQLKDFAADPGVGWHLKTGQFISNTWSVPKIDPFLYSVTPRSWVCDQWLSDFISFQLYSLGSWHLLYAFYAIIYLFSYFALLYPCVAVCSGNRLVSAVITYLAMRGGLIHFILRPVALGHFLFCALFVLISYFRIGRISKRKFIYLSLFIFLLWANLHPSFFLGFILCGGLLIEGLYKRVWLNLRNEDLPITVNHTCLLLLACVAVTLINPNGINLHESIFRLAKSDFFLSYNSEWQSLNFKLLEGRVTQIFLFILCTAPLLCCLKNGKDGVGKFADSFSVFTLLVFGHLAFEMVRTLPDFLIVASLPTVVAASISLRAMAERCPPILRPFVRRLNSVEDREVATWHGLPALLSLSVLILISVVSKNEIPFYSGEFGPPPESRATSIIKTMKEMAQKTDQIFVVFASPDLGGAITFYGEGFVRGVIDDRNTLIGSQLYKELAESYGSKVGEKVKLGDFAKSLGANTVLLRKDEPIAELLSRNAQRKIAEDEYFIAFVI